MKLSELMHMSPNAILSSIRKELSFRKKVYPDTLRWKDIAIELSEIIHKGTDSYNKNYLYHCKNIDGVDFFGEIKAFDIEDATSKLSSKYNFVIRIV